MGEQLLQLPKASMYVTDDKNSFHSRGVTRFSTGTGSRRGLMTDPTRRGIGGDYKFSIEVPVADVDRALQLVSLAELRRVAATGTLEVGQVVLGSTGTLTVKTQTLTDDLLFTLGATEVGRFSSSGLTLPGASNIIFDNAANHSITTTQSASTVGRDLTVSAGSAPVTATAASQNGGQILIVSGSGAAAVDPTFAGGAGGAISITTGLGGAGAGGLSGQGGGTFQLTGGSGGNAGATGFGGGAGGALQFTSGNGGTAGTTSGPGGAGGGITITTGNGGNASTGFQSGGTSGSLILTTGLGGAASATAAAGTTSSISLSPGNSRPALGTSQAGSAGGVIVSPGAGGAGGTSIGGSSAGQFLTLGSAGGIAGTVSGAAGSGSNFTWSGGAGGAANTGTGAAGAGGGWTATAGNGGAATTTGAAGTGGSFTLTAGIGGSSAASVNVAGVGGSLTFAGGAAGSNGGAGGNNGGGVTLRGGAATGAGVSGVVTIGATNTSAVNIGASSITSTIIGSARVQTTARTHALFVDNSNSRVSIGTNVADATLDVVGISSITGLKVDTTNAQWMIVGSNVAATNYMTLRRPGSVNALGYLGGCDGGAISGFTSNDLGIRSEAALVIATGGNVPRVTIGGTGNVGLTGFIDSYGNVAPSNGQMLIGHTANGRYQAATLTAGSGITITNGAAAVTVAQTGIVAAARTAWGEHEDFVGIGSTMEGTRYAPDISVGSTVTQSQTTELANELGVMCCTIGTGVNSRASIETRDDGVTLSRGDENILECRVFIETLSDVTNPYVLRVGFGSAGIGSTLGSPSICFEYLHTASLNWRVVRTSTAGTASPTTSAIPVVAGSWVKLRIERIGGTFSCFVNDVSVGVIAGSGTGASPSATGIVPLQMHRITAAGTTIRRAFIDYVAVSFSVMGGR
jgi:hypothetical protein